MWGAQLVLHVSFLYHFIQVYEFEKISLFVNRAIGFYPFHHDRIFKLYVPGGRLPDSLFKLVFQMFVICSLEYDDS